MKVTVLNIGISKKVEIKQKINFNLENKNNKYKEGNILNHY